MRAWCAWCVSVVGGSMTVYIVNGPDIFLFGILILV
jgi:hypothetical protein